MAGVFSYIAFMLILCIWGIGWMAIASLLGVLFNVPPKVSITAGLILGPLGVLYVVLLGITNKDWQKSAVAVKQRVERVATSTRSPQEEDPFQ